MGISLGKKWWQMILEKEISCSPWEGLACTCEWYSFFIFEGCERGIFFPPLFSQCVPIMFPWDSHQVLKMFPITSRFYPVLFAQGSTPMYINWEWGAKGKHDKVNSYFWEGGKFRLLCWGVPNVPKLLVMGQSNGSFFLNKTKRELWAYMPN
jgi:hypothetical protein